MNWDYCNICGKIVLVGHNCQYQNIFYVSSSGTGTVTKCIECTEKDEEIKKLMQCISELEEKLEKTEKHLKWVAETYCTED